MNILPENTNFASRWSVLSLDQNQQIQFANTKALAILAMGQVVGKSIDQILPWFRSEWLGQSTSRIVKVSPQIKLLLDVHPNSQQTDWYNILFRNVDEYHDTDHLWCEIQDSLIGMQPFINTCYDGIVITNGEGTVLLVNQAFSRISGIAANAMVSKSIFELTESGRIPHSCTMQVLKEKRSINTVVRYQLGSEALVSSTPLFDKQGHIVRVISNIRDVTELRELQDKLQSAKALARHYEKELKTQKAAENFASFGTSNTPAMKDVYNLIHKVSDTELPLLLTGESGVGKTALAKYIHHLSDRSTTGTFVHINCSAIPESLLESELFGYEAGAFTGAKQTKIGLFELAHKGTILLDEIGDMPLTLQAKILNILQEQRFYRIGGIKPIHVDVRIIAATNKNLEQLLQQRLFRLDLYYRLNVVPILIPPLRERKEDIPALLNNYLEMINRRYGKKKQLSPAAIDYLIQYDWPGNMRELLHWIERLVVLTNEDFIEPYQLPQSLLTNISAIPSDSHSKPLKQLWQPGFGLKGLIAKFESRIIEEAVSYCGTIKEAAKQLQIDESTLIRKRKRQRS